jgi:hypothetical protein
MNTNGNNIDQHLNDFLLDELDLHEECRSQCRSSIIMQYIELYPESLTRDDILGYLPLHLVFLNESSSIELALTIIEKYPAALKHRTLDDYLPLHIECERLCRSVLILACIEIYPETLAVADAKGNLPLNKLLMNEASSIDLALLMLEKYPAALKHRNKYGFLPLHTECRCRCRSTIISKFIELCPEALAKADETESLPLHRLLRNDSSSVDDVLIMIEKYPAAVRHPNYDLLKFPLYIECKNQCRSSIISKCIEIYPESANNLVIMLVMQKISIHNFYSYSSVLSIVFTALPMSLYDPLPIPNDVRNDQVYRRRILNLLSRHIFTPTHESDYRDLNWQIRAAMIMLLSQIKIQRSSKEDISSRDHHDHRI